MEHIEQLNQARKQRLLDLKARIQSDSKAAQEVRVEIQQKIAERGDFTFNRVSFESFISNHPLFSNLHKISDYE